MELINQIEFHKYDVLGTLYTSLPPDLFCNSSKLTHSDRYTLCGKFKKLERLIHSTNTQWWDEFFLKKYLKEKISPRGLRVLKTCSFLDTSHNTQWEGIAEFCTAKWLEVLVSQRNIKYNELVHNIQMLSLEIIAHQQKIPPTWLDTLKKNTKAKENTLIETKLNKFHRDLNDYSKGNICS